MARSQLIHAASVIQLERELVAEGRDASAIWGGRRDGDSGWAAFGPVLDRWIAQAALAIAEAAVSASAVIDFNAVIVDGVFPATVRDRLVQAVARAAEGFDRRGLSPMDVVPGSVGPLARPVGAATLPLMARFARDRDVLFKDAAE